MCEVRPYLGWAWEAHGVSPRSEICIPLRRAGLAPDPGLWRSCGAVVSAVFSFGGMVGSRVKIAGEVAIPKRTLPLLWWGRVALVIAIYTAQNIYVFAVVPLGGLNSLQATGICRFNWGGRSSVLPVPAYSPRAFTRVRGGCRADLMMQAPACALQWQGLVLSCTFGRLSERFEHPRTRSFAGWTRAARAIFRSVRSHARYIIFAAGIFRGLALALSVCRREVEAWVSACADHLVHAVSRFALLIACRSIAS